MKTEHTCWVNGWHAARDASLGKESASTRTLRRLFSAGGMFMVDQDQLVENSAVAQDRGRSLADADRSLFLPLACH